MRLFSALLPELETTAHIRRVAQCFWPSAYYPMLSIWVHQHTLWCGFYFAKVKDIQDNFTCATYGTDLKVTLRGIFGSDKRSNGTVVWYGSSGVCMPRQKSPEDTRRILVFHGYQGFAQIHQMRRERKVQQSNQLISVVWNSRLAKKFVVPCMLK